MISKLIRSTSKENTLPNRYSKMMAGFTHKIVMKIHQGLLFDCLLRPTGDYLHHWKIPSWIWPPGNWLQNPVSKWKPTGKRFARGSNFWAICERQRNIFLMNLKPIRFNSRFSFQPMWNQHKCNKNMGDNWLSFAPGNAAEDCNSMLPMKLTFHKSQLNGFAFQHQCEMFLGTK